MNNKYSVLNNAINIIKSENYFVCFYKHHISIYSNEFNLLFDLDNQIEVFDGCFSPDETKILLVSQNNYFMIYDVVKSVLSPKIFISQTNSCMPLADVLGTWDSLSKNVFIPVKSYDAPDKLYIYDSETYKLVRIEDFDNYYFIDATTYDNKHKTTYFLCRDAKNNVYVFSYEQQVTKQINVFKAKKHSMCIGFVYNDFLNELIIISTSGVYFVDPINEIVTSFSSIMKKKDKKNYRLLKLRSTNFINNISIENGQIVISTFQQKIFCIDFNSGKVLFDFKMHTPTTKIISVVENIWAIIDWDTSHFLVKDNNSNKLFSFQKQGDD